jgi:uncharacterized protein
MFFQLCGGAAVSPITQPAPQPARNVLGQPLTACSFDPLTGYFRDGCCKTDETDHGTHVVCAVMTDAFLQFSLQRGNDLVTPRPQWQFPGLRQGDAWCLCALRWQEAFEAGVAPPVKLESTHAKALQVLALADLQALAWLPDDAS